ncbi:hypothetical protein LTR78_001394 [Recurvomyces mirabilis]|uniref:ZZ-type domain-containing protein n=1 Tax=Recurvomyces mirabilis TaxID=574656 RepID=A0AAE0WVJ7_9PEZI|nr:hypothetical protein LTR78_001394 [Recurvomyces mirabilis]
MAAPVNHNNNVVPADTLITIKIAVNDSLKKLKLPLRDLGANVLPDKLRHVLSIKPEQTVVFERFSDSSGGFVTLDPSNPQVFKTLIRAAKAKLKLRLKATVTPIEQEEEASTSEATPAKPVKPVIVHSPVYQGSPASRESMAFDRRSVGSGIFQFREARASQQTLTNPKAEAPVPQPFTTDNKDFFQNLASPTALPVRNLGVPVAQPAPTVSHAWSVYCNECDKPMSDAHYHCSICDGGDYDLCEECVAGGKLCSGEAHWLIKRFIKDGKVVNSTTERISPRLKKAIRIEDLLKKPVQAESVEIKKEMPGAFAEDTKTLAEESLIPTRTCNNCVVVLPEAKFVTCTDCADFDLCISCHVANKHGHHPAHGFKPATDDTELSMQAEAMLPAGRNIRHNAICDGCDKGIYGVRHKCLNCPDWDFCNDCVKNARHIHPRHRFAAIYQPIADQYTHATRHFGIYCDGPLCSSKQSQTYITGVRYKCAVCHDMDFCANCEAFPGNHHNRTHPLIQFKTPVRNVSITTENEHPNGEVRMMGDRKQKTETVVPVQQASAAIPVQTVAEIKPSEVKQEVVESKTEQVAQPIPVIKSEAPKVVPIHAVPATMLQAHFVRDSIPDGTPMQAGARFAQIWTIKNPGPFAWPAGCSVKYIGGDNMLNIDNQHPASVTDIAAASESNVVGREVQVGEEVAFKVVLKAPARVGDSISYWRLKSADGTPFGHRLWCDIKVGEAQRQPSGMGVPQNIQFQQQQYANMAMRQRQMQIAQQQQQQAQLQAQLQAQQKQAQVQAQQRQAMQMMLAQERIRTMAATQAQDAQASSSGGPFGKFIGTPPAYNEVNQDMQSQLAVMRAQHQKAMQARAAEEQKKREGEAPIQNPFAHPPIAGPSTNATQNKASEDYEARKGHAKQRVDFIKAKIMRAREEAAQKSMQEELKKAEEATPVASGSEEKVRKIIEEVEKEKSGETEAEEEQMERSSMVFPKLDKESPASSTYQSATSSSTTKGKAAYVENEAGEVEREAIPATPVVAPVAISEPSVTSPSVEEDGFDDLSEEIEIMSAIAGDESEDDGFATDEEYEILSVGDEE